MDDVARHSATWRLAKSMVVWIPRLPTMRVIGSHDICIMSGVCLAGIAVAFRRLWLDAAPFRLRVQRDAGEAPQRADHRAVGRDRRGGHVRSRRLVHEAHELVRESRHRAADADTADVGATAD